MSSQKFIARNRAPRVQIEYDVELYGAEKKVQLPFVMGVLSDLSGKPTEPLPPGAGSTRQTPQPEPPPQATNAPADNAAPDVSPADNYGTLGGGLAPQSPAPQAATDQPPSAPGSTPQAAGDATLRNDD